MSNENQTKPSLASQSIWLMFAKFFGFVFAFLLPLFTFRILTKANVGIYQQIFVVIGTVSAILPFGVSMSAYYFLSREREKRSFYIFNILLFNFIVGGLACLFLNVYPQILGNIFEDVEMTNFAPKIGIVIWFWIFSTFLETVSIANQEAKLATTFIIFSQLTKMIFMVSAVVIFGTVDSMLNAALLQVVSQTIVLFIYLNSRFPTVWRSFDKKIFISQLKYALPFGLAGILWTLQTDAHNWFIGHRFSAEELATYRAGCFELPLLILFYESISSVMIPRMSELQSNGRIREMIELSARAMEKLSLFYFPAFVFFTITAYTLMTTLFTTKYADSTPIFVINIMLLPFYILITDPIVRSFESLGRFILKVRIFIVIALLITLWYGSQHFDLRGMIAIVVVTSLFDRFISTAKVWKTVGVKMSDVYLLKNIGKIAIASIIAGIPTYFVHAQIQTITPNLSETLCQFVFTAPEESLVESIAGFLTLGFTGVFFASLYLFGINYLGVISNEEKQFFTEKWLAVKKVIGFQTTVQRSLPTDN
jgi:O-antigen/teichoic acid export membrane protein